MDVYQEAIEKVVKNYNVTYIYKCNGCGKRVSGYYHNKVRGHVWCRDCKKKRDSENALNRTLKPFCEWLVENNMLVRSDEETRTMQDVIEKYRKEKING